MLNKGKQVGAFLPSFDIGQSVLGQLTGEEPMSPGTWFITELLDELGPPEDIILARQIAKEKGYAGF